MKLYIKFNLKEDIFMYVSGERPGVGIYMCVMCFSKLVIKSDDEILPECPDCNIGIYEKLK